MASTSLYPPTLDSYVPAFIGSGSCRIYYSLSKLSSLASDIKSIHISVIRQSTGKSVVNKKDNVLKNRYRNSGIIIINDQPREVQGATNLYYVDILNDDIRDSDNNSSEGGIGWGIGKIYKIQIRLSSVEYNNSVGQSAWLNSEANNFSEWSTYCTTKAIDKPRINIPLFKFYDSDEEENSYNGDKEYILDSSTFEFSGSYINSDNSETLYSYRLSLMDGLTSELIEDSGELYSNQYYTPNQLYYLFKTELQDMNKYILKLDYVTLNKYSASKFFNIIINQPNIETTTISVVTVDTMKELFKEKTCREWEDEEARIGIKLYSNNKDSYSGNLCIRRSDSKDNFSSWTDIKIINLKQEIINDLDIIYDYMIESGVWYKYGVQVIDSNGNRGVLNTMHSAVSRNFEYAYLVGEGGRQLKLKYDNTLNSYMRNYSESKTDTIGGKYPFITRNGNTDYRTIPINGIISFNMDDQGLFATDQTIYKYNDVITLYKEDRVKRSLTYNNDYAREHDFREEVLSFLQDGKPKLFKSATEGNIILRIMNVNTSPNQILNRMIYSFTSTAHEIAEPTMENYKKYNFFSTGEYETDFSIYATKIGQLDMNFNIGDNIIQLIYDKYDTSFKSMAGYKISVKNIHNVTLEFNDKPLKVLNNNGELVLGNNILLNSNKITVYASNVNRVYVIDPNINFTRNGNITVLGGADYDIQNPIHITVNFLYDTAKEPYVEKQIKTKTSSKGIAQIFKTFKPGENIYSEIYYKFYYEWIYEFRRLSNVTWTCIEADPGSVFEITDENDTVNEKHVIGYSGILNLEDLGYVKNITYLGKRRSDGTIDDTANADVMIDYTYYTVQGTYKEET